MLPTVPSVVHEEEISLEFSNHKMTGPVRWVTLLSADRTAPSETVMGF